MAPAGAGAPPGDAPVRRALLGSLPAPAPDVLDTLARVRDDWWAAAAAVAAVRAAGAAWRAADALQVLEAGAARTEEFDSEVAAALTAAKAQRASGGDDAAVASLDAWLDADAERAPRVLLRRQMWHMRWLLCVPLASSKTAAASGELAELAETPLLFHARSLALAGNARALRALLGAHPAVARTLFPHRFGLLHTLLTTGGVVPGELHELRLLPGTHMPVQDRESGAWIDGLDTSPLAATVLWVEHPLVATALAARGLAPPLPPLVPPAPPKALAAWYTGVIQELDTQLGLVDEALELARAGMRVGLAPLRTVAHELEFLTALSPRGAWSVESLHAASAREIVGAVVREVRAPDATVTVLREAVASYLARGAYADRHLWHALPPAALAARIVLLALGAPGVEPQRALEIACAALRARDAHDTLWMDDGAERGRLALALLAGWEHPGSGAYGVLRDIANSVPAGEPAPGGCPLTRVLARELTEPIDIPALWERLEGAHLHPVLAHALAETARYVELGARLAPWLDARPPRFYLVGGDSPPFQRSLGEALARRVGAQHVVPLLFDLAPLLHAPGSPAHVALLHAPAVHAALAALLQEHGMLTRFPFTH